MVCTGECFVPLQSALKLFKFSPDFNDDKHGKVQLEGLREALGVEILPSPGKIP